MIRHLILIITLFFIQLTNSYAFDNVRVNNRVITSAWISTVNKDVKKTTADKIIHYVFLEARRHKIDPLLLLSIISVESTFKTKTRSKAGAKGLMQVLPKWHKEKIRGRDINDIAVNIEVGTKIINDCLVKHKDNVNRALYCYLGGPSKSYSNKIAVNHKKLRQTIATQLFVLEQPIIILSSFNKPREYHDRLNGLQYNKVLIAYNETNLLE